MLGVTGSGVENVFKGIAALLWPAVALTAVLLFRPEIRDLLRRIRKGKLLGQEIELDESVTKLARDVEALVDAPLPPVAVANPVPTNVAASGGDAGSADSEITEVLTMAAASPVAALIQLAARLERDGRRLLAATGHLKEVGPTPSLRRIAETLERVTTMPRGSLDAFRSFADLRNRIVHGHGEASDDEILRVIDSGLVLLRSLAAAPRERNVVHRTGVEIYGDDGLTERLPGWGVILETTSAGGAVTSYRIFPTTRTHFTKGMEVAWEWSDKERWDQAFYKDPDSGEVRSGWDGALEFIGRDIDDI